MKAIIIEVDKYKESIDGYRPNQARVVHRKSAQLADKAFEEAIAKEGYFNVILMCGGSCSGKTEFVSSQLAHQEGLIVYDGTLYNIVGARTKISKAHKNGKKVIVIGILPDEIKNCFGPFLSRERRVPREIFFKTHSGCRATLLWLIQNRPQVSVQLYESYEDKRGFRVREIPFESKDDMLEYVINIQRTQEEVEFEIKP